MDHRKRLVPIATTINDPSALDLANARRSVFILVFDVSSQKCFAQPGDHHSCQARDTGSGFSKNTRRRIQSSEKCPVTKRSFKKSSKASSKPKASELERLAPNLAKARETKKLFEMNITLERKEIFSNFERKSSLESLAQNIPEWPSPSHARNLSFTHDGYIRHTATEMIILMTDISVIWHSTGQDLRLSATCNGRVESDAGISEISMHRVALQSQGSQCVFNLQEHFLSSSLIVERWRAKHQLRFPISYGCTLNMQVSQIWQTRGGRKTVTKAINRKHKTRTAKMLGVELFSVEKTKPKQRHRLPPTTAVRVTVQDSLQCCTLF